jgi:hypothetical protein
MGEAVSSVPRRRTDRFGKIPEFKYCAARVQPIAMPAASQQDQLGAISMIPGK